MRVIFLDFDGVLNSEEFMRRQWADRQMGKVTFMHRHSCEISPEMARRVLAICEQADAKIVISSTWRLLHSLQEIKAMLIEIGVPALAERIIDRTPNPRRGRSMRGDEIAMWLRGAPEVTGYVIIDDDSDMLNSQRPRFVQTDWTTGIMDHHIPMAVNALALEMVL